MRSILTRVRQAALLLLLALLSPGAVTNAQVAIQVKNPSLSATWSSDVQVSSLVPLTFRWRWDGAETPTSVAWQLATVTPTSTATTRATDVIASETGMRLPAKAGVYEQFTVTPASTWPSKFYVRVRVNIGRKSVYSRWTIVSVVPERTSFVANPTCSIQGEVSRSVEVAGSPGVFSSESKSFAAGGTYELPWRRLRLLVTIKNSSRYDVTYRRSIRVLLNGKEAPHFIPWIVSHETEADPMLLRKVAGATPDELEMVFQTPPDLPGKYEIFISIKPVGAAESECKFWFNIGIPK